MDKLYVAMFDNGMISISSSDCKFKFVKQDDLYAIESDYKENRDKQIEICEEIINLYNKLKEVIYD